DYEAPPIHQAEPAELALLQALPQAFAVYDSLPTRDRLAVQRVVETLISGMQFDLERFEPQGLVALDDESELERYIYLVAGCVGEFWTVVTRRHSPALASWDPAVMEPLGIHFGKALQLTNVLRDLPRDLRNGRCYLPLDELAQSGLVPSDLLLPGNSPKAAPILCKWLHRASAYYSDAVRYLVAIPPRCLRLRLAALWPVLIGLATLNRLAAQPDWLEPGRVIKVSRSWIYAMLLWSVPLALCNPLLRLATQVMLTRLNTQNAALEESR
ncbi:MAG: squalene/phytoene synthase family protein, partial [Candidatus Eremiobacteraeota bacterium]|nr:squalene/phytoene synthase family protein [Candidatus Eremiobacteraeota bacterium]